MSAMICLPLWGRGTIRRMVDEVKRRLGIKRGGRVTDGGTMELRDREEDTIFDMVEEAEGRDG